ESGRLELYRQINSGRLPASTAAIAEPWQRLIRACLVIDPNQRVRNCEACKALLAETAPEAGQGSTKVDTPPMPAPQRPAAPPPQRSVTPLPVSMPPVPRFSELNFVLRVSLGVVAALILLFVLVGIFGNLRASLGILAVLILLFFILVRISGNTGKDGGSDEVQ
ncbi:MAG: hypothetical protein LBP98_03645, partial [Tannerella sp.]|nr:hypothetical protein [Tannerella sp.]